MAKGECNCGQVRFEVTTALEEVYLCHCSICRRATGSGAIAVVVVPKDRFHWLSGAESVKTWQKPGHDWQTSFCSHCGSPLPGENDKESVYVPVGLLTDGDEKLSVAHHIWVGSKAGWEEIGDQGQCHLQGFSG